MKALDFTVLIEQKKECVGAGGGFGEGRGQAGICVEQGAFVGLFEETCFKGRAFAVEAKNAFKVFVGGGLGGG